MDNGVVLLQRVVDETTLLFDNVGDDQLGNATPCTEWTIRDLMNHVTGGATMFAVSAEQGSVPDDVVAQLMGGDNLGDDPHAAWRAASQRALSASRTRSCSKRPWSSASRWSDPSCVSPVCSTRSRPRPTTHR